jgi:hypothetical protein
LTKQEVEQYISLADYNIDGGKKGRRAATLAKRDLQPWRKPWLRREHVIVFLTMSSQRWMDRVTDDPIFERDVIVLNDNGNVFRGLRDQKVRGNNKLIFAYLQKLGGEGILAGAEYENILRLATYNVTPAKSERQRSIGTRNEYQRSSGQKIFFCSYIHLKPIASTTSAGTIAFRASEQGTRI